MESTGKPYEKQPKLYQEQEEEKHIRIKVCECKRWFHKDLTPSKNSRMYIYFYPYTVGENKFTVYK